MRAGPTLREATVVVEQSLAGLQPTPGLAADTAVVSTSLVPVTIRTEFDGPGCRRAIAGCRSGNYVFVIPSPTGGLLVEAEVSRTDLAEARARWRDAYLGGERRRPRPRAALVRGAAARPAPRRARTAPCFLAATIAVAVILLIAARALALGRVVGGRPSAVRLAGRRAADRADRGGSGRARGRPRWPGGASRARGRALWLQERPEAHSATTASRRSTSWPARSPRRARRVRTLPAASRRAARTSTSLHFSLHPFSVEGLAVGFGLVLLHAAVRLGSGDAGPRRRRVLAAAPALGSSGHRDDRLACRRRRDRRGVITRSGRARFRSCRGASRLPPAASAPPRSTGCRAARAARRRPRGSSRSSWRWSCRRSRCIRRSSSFATAAKERLIATTYAPQAMSQRKDLQDRLYQALEQIDAMPGARRLRVRLRATVAAPTIDRAFAVWSKTELATYRLTSSVELYGATARW